MISCWRLMRLAWFRNTVSSKSTRRSHRIDLQRALALASTVAIAANLSGCIILPIPVARTAGAVNTYRSNIGDQTPTPFVQGTTTRRQVLLDLGEPDGRAADDSWFTYEAVSRRPGLHWAYVVGVEGGNGSIGAIDSWDTARRLTIRFDERGVVAAASLDRKNCTNSFLDTANCPSAVGSDIAQADEERRGEQLIASSGSVLGRYGPFELLRGTGAACAFRHNLPESGGDQFIVMQQRVAWRDRRQHWDSVAVADIEDVKPVEKHMMARWIPVATRDGSCLFVHLQTILQSSNNEAQMQIGAAVTAARAAHH
jgi:hypothetical protein